MQLDPAAAAAGFGVLAHRTLASTNAEALSHGARHRGADRLWVLAQTQTAGRGRGRRAWVSPPGNLYATLLLRDPAPPSRAAELSFVAGLSVHDAILDCAPSLRGALALDRREFEATIVTGSGDRTVRRWDLTTREQLGTPPTGHRESVGALATTLLDGRPIAVTGSSDKTARVWDIRTGQPLGAPLTGHTEDILAIAITELDGRSIFATSSDDKTVRVWDLATREQIGPELVFPARVRSMAAAPDGRLVVVFGWEVAVLAPR